MLSDLHTVYLISTYNLSPPCLRWLFQSHLISARCPTPPILHISNKSAMSSKWSTYWMKPCCHVNVLSFWDMSGAFDNQNRRLTLKYHATLDVISMSDNQNGWLTWLYYMPLDMISVSHNWNGSLTSLCYLSLDRIRHIIIEMEGSPCCTMQHILLRWNWVDFFIYEAINAEWTSCNLHTGLVLPCQVAILHRNEFWHLTHSKLKCTQPNSC